MLKHYGTIACTILFFVTFGIAQDLTGASLNPPTGDNAGQVARILGISKLVTEIRTLREQVPCGMPATMEELSLRQTVMETIVATSLDADGVLSELNNEAAQLSETSARLQSRRDRAVNTANLANLVTGTGLGIGVNALQFSSSTANIGNGLGVASGIASTLLSIVGIRLQRGPKIAVGRVPNMLAPLFGQEPKLNTFYSPEVLTYLRSIPESNQPSRLDELFAEWRESGRIGAPDSPGNKKKIQLLTAGNGDKVKLSINDLSDRTAMLTDVAGKVALMKRDLAALMLSVRPKLDCGAR